MTCSLSRSPFVELQEAIRLFFQEQIQLAADESSRLAVEPLLKGQLEIQTLLDQWLKLFQVTSLLCACVSHSNAIF